MVKYSFGSVNQFLGGKLQYNFTHILLHGVLHTNKMHDIDIFILLHKVDSRSNIWNSKYLLMIWGSWP